MAKGRKTGGRQRGSKNKRTHEQLREVENLADFMFDDFWKAAAKQRIMEGTAPHLESFLLAHKYGKPTERHEIANAPGETFKTQEAKAFPWALYERIFISGGITAQITNRNGDREPVHSAHTNGATGLLPKPTS